MELWWLNIFMFRNSTETIFKIYNPPKTYEGECFKAWWAAKLIEARFQSLMKVINGILPIIYTILGAVAFGVRDIRTRSSTPTWTVASEVGANLRLLLAVFVGSVLGIFTDFAKGASLPPIAVGFLAGYGVEYFFEFLDNLLKTFGFRSTLRIIAWQVITRWFKNDAQHYCYQKRNAELHWRLIPTLLLANVTLGSQSCVRSGNAVIARHQAASGRLTSPSEDWPQSACAVPRRRFPDPMGR
jgi:hypothetical protein